MKLTKTQLRQLIREEVQSINEGMSDLEFVVDQLANSMEYYDEKEFVKHISKETKYNANSLKKVFNAYWDLNAIKRDDMFTRVNTAKPWLKKFGIKEEIQPINEGKKKFRVNLHAIGKAKYSIDFYDGKSKHKDGGDFWGINIFKNKKDLANAIKDYTKKGYVKESINEGGIGILSKDQTDVLHAIVMKNKNKNSKAILSIVMKDRMFKGVDKKELLGYIEGAKQFVRYMGRTGNESVKEERDYKAEYKKYGSSTKAKKYRAELNKYNRQKGTYGNGDGKDASHKGGKIVGFEAESKNRGRKEKSRLKKESALREMIREEIKNLQEKKTWYYNIGRGVYIMDVDSYKIDKSKEAKNGYPNADHLLSSTKQASDWVTKKNNIKEFVIKEAVKDPKLKVGQKIRFDKSNRVFTLKKITVGNVGIPDKDDPSGTSYMFVAPGNRKEYFTKKTWNDAVKKGWLQLESLNERTRMKPQVKKLLKQKGYGPIFGAIDSSKQQLKQMRYSRGEIRDTLISMFGDEDPKILQKIKESINEKISKEEWAQYPKYARKLK